MANLCRSIKRNIARNNDESYPKRTHSQDFYFRYLRKHKNKKTGKITRNINLT